jgi:hypothetical protein
MNDIGLEKQKVYAQASMDCPIAQTHQLEAVSILAQLPFVMKNHK